jgi:dTDP-4-amino-4,6-dideoxygalactose transaminase
MNGKPIYVTKPYLPPLEEFIPYLEKIWENNILTNSGPFHQKLEQALCDYLGVKHISLFGNGTLALMTALQVLDLKGEVITTPYTFAATTNAIVWNNLTPVFVDIHPDTLNLDAAKLGEAITPKTTAILPVHCYGQPCDVSAIEKVARKHKLYVMYDAAHAFGVRDMGGSILRHGDLAVLSFHATKVFNTFEGGAIVSPDSHTKQRVDQLKNFGIVDDNTIVAAGINGKMSEFNAALGLLQLDHVDDAIAQRKVVDAAYRDRLATVDGVRCLNSSGVNRANYSYFPIMFDSDFSLSRDDVFRKLKESGIFARRYFYPLVSDFDVYKRLHSSSSSNLPNATKAAQQVLCLPIYPGLEVSTIDRICRLIKEF